MVRPFGATEGKKSAKWNFANNRERAQMEFGPERKRNWGNERNPAKPSESAA